MTADQQAEADRREEDQRRRAELAEAEAARLYRELQEACAELARKNRGES